ncbi:Rz1-like lysis system protein LysC [Gilliamella sp. wkB171]|uniref:Rz1-like lysis system protein LysC n=1 Tax=Gilliamella sp. wkB171 TaxID=3120258 RepID=UPI003FA545EE
MFLVILLTACTKEQKVYINRPISESLLTDCLPALPPKPLTFASSLKYNEHLLNVIEKCNQDKRAIRALNQ